jgi:uncharacterized protein YndB with AHSA1/START domain
VDAERAAAREVLIFPAKESVMTTQIVPGALVPDFRFRISRVFDAPRDLVWEAWTDEVHLLEWWRPKGFRTRFAKLDLRPGGIFHYGLESPQGEAFCGRFVYRAIEPPSRLEFVLSFADEKAGIARHIWNELWPLEILHVVTFADKGGKTEVSVTSHPINATAAEIAAFEAGAPSMQAGYGGTFDNLDDLLAQRRT